MANLDLGWAQTTTAIFFGCYCTALLYISWRLARVYCSLKHFILYLQMFILIKLSKCQKIDEIYYFEGSFSTNILLFSMGIIAYSNIIMHQKENHERPISFPRKENKGISSKLSGEANDFVLKRYRLQQNKLFKQKQLDELRYETTLKKSTIEVEEDIEDELVIVPLELSRCKQSGNEEQPEPYKEAEGHEIYVFDDEDEDSQQANQDSIYHTQNSAFHYQENSLSSPSNHSQLHSAKPFLRDNWSPAELITPNMIETPQKTSKHNSGNALEKICQFDHFKFRQGKEDEQQGIQNLKGVKIGKQSGKHVSITITDKKMFSLSKLPSGIILKCIIKRTSSILSLMSPQFDLYLANGLKHILSAKKYPLKNRELFRFSVDPLKFEDSAQIAVMHANNNHNIYWVLDQPRRIGDVDLSLIYLVIGYYKMKSDEKHRRFTALLPPTSNSQYQLAMDYELKSINFSNIKEEIRTQITNLPSWKNQTNNSTKNFVLADDDDPDYRYLQMKKQSDDVFQLTIQHPFSPLQAMAIAMTRFDVQLK